MDIQTTQDDHIEMLERELAEAKMRRAAAATAGPPAQPLMQKSAAGPTIFITPPLPPAAFAASKAKECLIAVQDGPSAKAAFVPAVKKVENSARKEGGEGDKVPKKMGETAGEMAEKKVAVTGGKKAGEVGGKKADGKASEVAGEVAGDKAGNLAAQKGARRQPSRQKAPPLLTWACNIFLLRFLPRPRCGIHRHNQRLAFLWPSATFWFCRTSRARSFGRSARFKRTIHGKKSPWEIKFVDYSGQTAVYNAPLDNLPQGGDSKELHAWVVLDNVVQDDLVNYGKVKRRQWVAMGPLPRGGGRCRATSHRHFLQCGSLLSVILNHQSRQP
eukprot:jgi/Mesvir1/7343/Mv19152-RA.1